MLRDTGNKQAVRILLECIIFQNSMIFSRFPGVRSFFQVFPGQVGTLISCNLTTPPPMDKQIPVKTLPSCNLVGGQK